MRARTTILVVALAVAAVAAIPVAGLAATDSPVAADQHGNSTDANSTDANSTDANSTDANASVAPGERLSGVVGIQEAELEGEVDGRAFGLRVASAATNESRADVVADQLKNVGERLEDLEQRRQELEEARENGSVSEGRYRAEVAELATRTETVKELTNDSENASQGLPADLLESKGINVDAIQTLKDRAANMTGPEVAEIARSIAGNAAPVDAGPDERPGKGDGQQGPPADRGGQDTGEETGPPAETPSDGSDAGQQDGAGNGQQDGETATATPSPDGGSDGDSDGSDRGGGSDGSDRGGSSGSGGGSSGGDGGDGGDGGAY